LDGEREEATLPKEPSLSPDLFQRENRRGCLRLQVWNQVETAGTVCLQGATIMEGCQQYRVMDTVEWLVTHKSHGEPVKQLNEHQPPSGSYELWTFICPCGSRHVVNDHSDKPSR
jgi:hypothetical protein